jgi:chromosome segregation ATPase
MEDDKGLKSTLELAIKKIGELKSERDELKLKLEKISLDYGKLYSENEKIHLEVGKLKQVNISYLELFQKAAGDYAAIDLEEKQVQSYIKGLVGKYEKLENTLKEKENELKEKNEKIGGLEKGLAEVKEKYSAFSIDYEKLKEETSEEGKASKIIDKQIDNFSMINDLEKENSKYAGKISVTRKKIRNLKYAAVVLGMLSLASVGYIIYSSYEQVQKK